MKNITLPYSRGLEQLIQILIIGGGILVILSIGMMIYGVMHKKCKRFCLCWGVVFTVSVLSLFLGLLFSTSGRYMA